MNSVFPYTVSSQKVLDLDLFIPDPEEVKAIYEEG